MSTKKAVSVGHKSKRVPIGLLNLIRFNSPFSLSNIFFCI